MKHCTLNVLSQNIVNIAPIIPSKPPKDPYQAKRWLCIGVIFIVGIVTPTSQTIPQPVPHYIRTYTATLYQDGHATVVPTSEYWELGPTP